MKRIEVDRVPSILMVTWNRREYFEKTAAHLFNDPSDFRVYFWDNGSGDGVRDLISDLKDDRIIAKRYSPENVGQFAAWHWFLSVCRGTIAGKLDDDIVGERGWMVRFSEMLAERREFGLLGGWVFLKSDWDEATAQHKIVQVGPYTIFRNGWVPGGIFLGRLEELRRFSSRDPSRLGVPIEQVQMTKVGYINGFPLPLCYGEHLDDPRSPHCRMNRPGGYDEFASYTARMRKFSGPEDYARWIAADARQILEMSIVDQVRMSLPTRTDRLKGKIRRGIDKLKPWLPSV